MKIIATFLTAVLFSSCAYTQNNAAKIFPAVSAKPVAGEMVATFSEGCFWHAEIVFQSLAGVRDAVSGYAGGTSTSPTYDEVASGETGHAETVNVYYDPAKITYGQLADAFFASMDPTELNMQGNDVGTEYRSIAFYRNDAEKKIINDKIAAINASKKYSSKVVTQVLSFVHFYPAESYHQEYILHNPDNSYVHNVSIPDYTRFRQSFKGAAFKS